MNKKYIYPVLIAAFAWSALGGSALASEVNGSLTTGIGSPNNVDGTVMVPPTASVAGGTYGSAQSITFALPPGTLSVHYTTDGTDPTCAATPVGTVYSGAISVGGTQTLKAISCYPNNRSSAVVSFAYVINPPVVLTGGGDNSGGGGGGGGGGFSPIPTGLTLAQRADTNRDGRVDLLDFNALMVNWGSVVVGNIADFNLDNTVGILDFNILMIYWTI